MVITHIDSIRTYQMDSLDNEIEGTEKLAVKKYNFRIRSDGEIVKDENFE